MHKLNIAGDTFPTLTELFSCNNGILKICSILFAIVIILHLVFKFSKIINTPKRKRKIPGPSSLPIIGSVHHLFGPEKDLFKLMTNFCLKYGKIVQGKVFGLNIVLLNDPAYIKTLLTSTSPDHLNKPHQVYHKILGGNAPNGVISSEYPVWKHHRKVISRPLAIHHQIGKVNLYVRKILRPLHLTIENNKENGVFNSISENALGMILDIIMDMKVATEAERQELHKNVVFNKQVTGRRITNPWLLVEFIWKFHPLRKQMVEASSKVKIFLDRMYKTYTSSNQDSPKEDLPDLGGKVVSSVMAEMVASGFSNDDVFQEVVTVIEAGYETTTWSTMLLLLCLALNPDHQEKCRREVDKLFEKSKRK